MCDLRAAKVAMVADDIPPLAVEGPEKGDLLVLGWGGTYGSIHMAVAEWNKIHPDRKVSAAHLRYLNPMPKNTGQVIKSFEKILIPELNAGQLSLLIRGRFAVQASEMHKLQGRPFMVAELLERFAAELDGGKK
jgi:2-oxoglutarate ferredoxin oxidoreductase subunit alpha